MQAIILAAGMGKRLREFTKNNTKCMVKVNGIPLIDRMLSQLSELNLNRVIIVVGYKGDELIQHIGHRYDQKLDIEYVFNHVYDKTNNIYSLALASDKLLEDDTLLIESDLILDDNMFRLILDNPYPNLALVAKYQTWMDGTMVKIDEDCNIVNFIPKKAFNYEETDQYYKTVNVYKFGKEFSAHKYVPFLKAYTEALGNNEYYEQVLRVISFLDKSDLKALPINGEKWYESDDKADLNIAEALFAEGEHHLELYSKRYGGYWRFPEMLDFCYLVNPFFPSQKMLDEMNANFKVLLTEYPSGMTINTLLASKCFNVSEDFIVPGNGAAELIKSLMSNLEGKIGVVYPTFEEYPNRVDPSRLVVFTPEKKGFNYNCHDLISFFSDNPVQNLIIINPDNPSGNLIPVDELITLVEWSNNNHVRLVVDESFADFSVFYPKISLLDDEILLKNNNLVVMKSISKSFGVPGLRLGILASSDTKLIKKIKADVSIWNINSFAEFFMQIFNKYEKDYQTACVKFQSERELFYQNLNNIKYLKVYPSEANYFLCEVLPPYDSHSLAVRLLEECNILIKDCSKKKGFEGRNFIRLAVRGRSDNNRLVEALKIVQNGDSE